MKLSVFNNAWDDTPKPWETTWENFAQALGPIRPVPVSGYTEAELNVDKKRLQCFSPAEYKPGSTRGVDGVLRLWLFVADMDHLTEQTALEACQKVRDAGYAAVIYTSWKHAVMPWRLRIVIPLSRAVEPEDWPAFWEQMNIWLDNRCDPGCKDVSRVYFGPFAPAGTEDHNFYVVLLGTAMLVDPVLGAARERRDPDRGLAIRKLAEAWPSGGKDEPRHKAHMALAGALLLSGVSEAEAVEVLCQVAVTQDPNNEDRPKREGFVQRTKERIQKKQKVVGWTELTKYVKPDVVMFAKQVLEAPPKVTADQLKLFADSLAAKKDDRQKELGRALQLICKGEDYAAAPNRTDVAVRLSHVLAERFIHGDPLSIADHFTTSFQLIGLTSSMLPTLDDIVFHVKRRQDELKSREREKKLAEISQAESRLKEAWNDGRTTPYTSDEILSFGEITKRWIIQSDRSYYFFFNGSYVGPYTESAAPVAMARDLAPAASAGVQLYTFTEKDGKTFKSLKALTDEYGTVAKQVVLDLTAQKSTYDERFRAIIEAPCPVRPIVPTYHADIDQWMWILAGDQYENLKTWMAIATRLDLVCVAPFLVGERSVGKSMFGLGMARLFGTSGPTSLESAFEPFNDSLLQNPITLADEALPKNFRGQPETAKLRLFIQQRERTVRRKFIANAKLLGCTRTIICAHDISILRSTEHMSENEVTGTSERLLYIPCNPDAARFLETINTFERGWVDGDKIAEHALWLRDNHPHQSQGRFYIKSANEEVVRMLSTGSGVKSMVCQFLVSYLLKTSEYNSSTNNKDGLIRVVNGELHVNVRGVSSMWKTAFPNEFPPSTSVLSAAISELSVRRAKLPGEEGRVNYRVIENKNLFSWAEHMGFASREEIEKGLGLRG